MIKLIAEIGINHNGNLAIAKKLIDLAVFCGFDYVKFQKRTPEICVPENKKNEMRDTPWGAMTYLEYKERIEFKHSDYVVLNNYCGDKIKWFASVWDMTSAERMSNLMSIVKIPSALITNLELLRYCRDTYETLIISTGMSTEEEIQKAVKVGNPDVIMHTNSVYPTPIEDINLNYIKRLQKNYKVEIGYSGHEWGLTHTFVAAGLGVDWIERHITLNHDMFGTDQKASVDPVGCIKLCRGIREIENAMGNDEARIITKLEKDKREYLKV